MPPVIPGRRPIHRLYFKVEIAGLASIALFPRDLARDVRMAREQQMPVMVEVVKKRRRWLCPRATEMDAIVGKRLRTARKLANITQQELAEVLGVSFQAVQKYESGENRITAPARCNAADFLGADIRFFTTTDFEGVAQRIHSSLAGDESELLRVYRT